MGLTINNSATLSLLTTIGNISNKQNDLLNQLTTNKKINKGSDNPAGLVALTNLNSELTSVNAALDNGQRADSMLSVADGALNQMGVLLDQIQSLAAASTSSSGLSAAELAANQAQIDQAVSSIDKIVGSTSFNGKKLLDGTQGVTVTGVDATKIGDVKVYSRNSESTSTNVTVAVTGTATKATSTGYATTSATAATTISITGKLGTAIINIATGENLSSIADKIQSTAAQTGVTASATAANTNLSLISSDYGKSSFILVQNLSGDSTNFTNKTKTTGADAQVSVNGQQANVDGLGVNFNAGGVSVSFSLATGFTTGSSSFTVGDGGATFQLGTDSSTRATIGINAMFSNMLGSTSLGGYLSSVVGGGANSLTADPAKAVQIIKEAVQQVALARGRVGGFQKYMVGTSMDALKTTKQALTDATDSIDAVDYAQTTSELNRQQVLMNAAVSLLGIANSQSQSVLSLLK